MTPFEKLKHADADAAQHLLEVTGHAFAGERGGLATWCKRLGCSIDELDAATRAFRVGLDHGQRVPHVEYL